MSSALDYCRRARVSMRRGDLDDAADLVGHALDACDHLPAGSSHVTIVDATARLLDAMTRLRPLTPGIMPKDAGGL